MCGIFCTNCGKCRGEHNSVDRSFCIHCGAEVKAGSAKCDKCGAVLPLPPYKAR